MKLSKAYEVSSVILNIQKPNPPILEITIKGSAPSSGWSSFGLIPYVYIEPPLDGIYDFDLVGIPPKGVSSPAVTEIDPPVVDNWDGFPEESLRGVRIHASQNSVETLI